MLPLVGIEPRASDFHALYATVWANSPFAGSPRLLGPCIVMLYWFLDFFVKETNLVGPLSFWRIPFDRQISSVSLPLLVSLRFYHPNKAMLYWF